MNIAWIDPCASLKPLKHPLEHLPKLRTTPNKAYAGEPNNGNGLDETAPRNLWHVTL